MVVMAASPREDATNFEYTWNESDAAFLDPKSLPIQRLPRAWDRKQEVKTVANGKKKEIWRRYGTRSRTSDATTEDPEDDIRARPVKRQQRLSPRAIEKSGNSRFGRTRAFKATRWDRRKSVLPRKRTTGADSSLEEKEEEEEEEEEDTTTTDLGNDSFSEMNVDAARVGTQHTELLPEGEDRRATFTFLFNDEKDASLLETTGDRMVYAGPTSEPMEQDASTTRLFQAAPATPVNSSTISETLSSPKVPQVVASEDSRVTPVDQANEADDSMEANVHAGSVAERLAHDPDVENEYAEVDPSVQQAVSIGDAPTTAFASPALPRNAEQDSHMDDSTAGDADAILSPQMAQNDTADIDLEGEEDDPENFTEASLQLNIEHDMQLEDPVASSNNMPVAENDAADDIEDCYESSAIPSPTADDAMDDITSGLTLGHIDSSREATPRRLRSPSPPPRAASGPDDATMTFAFDDDTALLKDFLSRAAASKANKAENIARRESLQNRRDSDVVRHALASPRKALEDKDPNSPSKHDTETTLSMSPTLTLDIETTVPSSPGKAQAQTQTQAEAEDGDESKEGRASRRSSRARKSRLPAPLSIPTGPPKISVKRDGADPPVVLKKTDAQELSLLTRSNTRKNKQGAVAVNLRLLKLSLEARMAEGNMSSEAAESVVQVPGKKYVRWDTQLAYFQENTEAIADARADEESLSTPDELTTATPAAKPSRVKVAKVAKVDKEATPKVRKVKNLGPRNGTPGKGLLATASLLPDDMLADKDEVEDKRRLPKPKVSSRVKQASVSSTATTSAPGPAESRLPVLEVAPVGLESAKAAPAKERKSRLATPRKVKLPQLSSSSLGDGKENQGKGSAAPTVKKGIPMPSVVVPPTAEKPAATTGLPRRRGRKL